jgi:HEAT repeat protein
MSLSHATLPAPNASIRKCLTGGDPRALQHADVVVSLVLSRPDRVSELINCILTSDDAIVRMRAVDALEKVGRARPCLLQPYARVILDELSSIDQPSAQWHVAQLLGLVHLTTRQRAKALQILRRNLDESSDWLVLNFSLDTLAILARQDPSLVPTLRSYLTTFERSPHKSLLSRARRLRDEFG